MRAAFIFLSTVESKEHWAFPRIISWTRGMRMRRKQEVGFILQRGSALRLGRKGERSWDLFVPLRLGRRGEENMECIDGGTLVWVHRSLHLPQQLGGLERVAAEWTYHQKVQKRSAGASLPGRGDFMVCWVKALLATCLNIILLIQDNLICGKVTLVYK